MQRAIIRRHVVVCLGFLMKYVEEMSCCYHRITSRDMVACRGLHIENSNYRSVERLSGRFLDHRTLEIKGKT